MDIFSNLETFSKKVNLIYAQAIDDYHIVDSTDHSVRNPFAAGTLENLLYLKCWIDTMQWHVEDDIRSPEINPEHALKLKRQIDKLNQDRTNKVEQVDAWLSLRFQDVRILQDARVNTESPAWAIDRLSILALKIYHMKLETFRAGTSGHHRLACKEKLSVLAEQQGDLLLSINELLQDIANGKKIMKVYRQMKMYNDPELNPVLYNLSPSNPRQ